MTTVSTGKTQKFSAHFLRKNKMLHSHCLSSYNWLRSERNKIVLPSMVVIGCRGLHVCIWWRPHCSIWWGEEGWIEVKGRWDGPRGRYSQMRR